MGRFSFLTKALRLCHTHLTPTAARLASTGHLAEGLVPGVELLDRASDGQRPLLTSNTTQVPFLIVMSGAIGGIAAFWLVGVFLGPIILGIAAAIWREWAAIPQR